MTPLLHADNLGFAYRDSWVLRDIGFELAAGEFLGIIGPNGAGKSTLLKLMDGILLPGEGTIRLLGKPVEAYRRQELARRVAVVPPEALLVFSFSVAEVVLMGRSPHLGRFDFESEKDLEIVQRAMEMTDIAHLADRAFDTLSSGEKQRAMIARALAQKTDILLLDEPTAFLDIRHQIDIFNLIRRFNREEGLTVVAVTHDINLASLYCDRVMLLHGGRLAALGEPETVITEERIYNVYETRVLVGPHPRSGKPQIAPLGEEYQEEAVTRLSVGGSRCNAGAAPQL